MKNLDFLTKILTSEHDYWLVSKQDSWVNNKTHISVWMIVIPYKVRRNLKREEILLTDLEILKSCEIENISISEPYAPFQRGISMYNIIDGFPIVSDQKKFLIEALALGSNDIYDYQKLLITNN